MFGVQWGERLIRCGVEFLVVDGFLDLLAGFKDDIAQRDRFADVFVKQVGGKRTDFDCDLSLGDTKRESFCNSFQKENFSIEMETLSKGKTPLKGFYEINSFIQISTCFFSVISFMNSCMN